MITGPATDFGEERTFLCDFDEPQKLQSRGEAPGPDPAGRACPSYGRTALVAKRASLATSSAGRDQAAGLGAS
jgi:hypothetical protein